MAKFGRRVTIPSIGRSLAATAALAIAIGVVPLASAAHATTCPTPTITVSTQVQLASALAAAVPGDVISIADGTYEGAHVATTSGTETSPIWLCGGPGAMLTNGGWTGGYALHLNGASWWHLFGFTVTSAQKGVIVDAANHVTVEGLSANSLGDEGIHLRTNTVDSLVIGNTIHNTGNRRQKFGEGVYIGSSDANWGILTGGLPDHSDRNTVANNVIYGTTAESVDIKEGTADGVLSGNSFDGAAQTLEGADSWVDVKGNGWVISGNTGIYSTGDGFQTHHRNLTNSGLGNWGLNNTFSNNVADVQGPGRGFYIHDPSITGNIVYCNNTVTGATLGYANLACTTP